MAAAPHMAAFQRHGGRVSTAQDWFPDAPRPWLDLSTGINPWAYPLAPQPRAALRSLPDPAALGAAEVAAAKAFGVPHDRIAATSGAEAALRLLPWLLRVPRVAVAIDTYGGHAEAWEAAGIEVVASPRDAEAWVAVNPNNPDGRVTPKAELLRAAETRWTIVDESFADGCPDLSIAAHAGGRLIVLRSFGKFFGLPGLRLGFVLAAPELIARVKRAQGDWPLGPAAIEAARAAYPDFSWAMATRERLTRAAARLDRLLQRYGFEVVGGTSLFRLARAADAERRFLQLASAGVLCRPFADATRLRFGLPGSARSWARLASALKEIRHG